MENHAAIYQIKNVSGFVSEEEAAVAAGGRSKRPSDRGNGLWRVDLPVLSRG